jgi:integrase/recombinase XerC
MGPPKNIGADIPFAAPDVVADVERWLAYLGSERGMSPKTVEAYGRDLHQFLSFLSGHLGARLVVPHRSA